MNKYLSIKTLTLNAFLLLPLTLIMLSSCRTTQQSVYFTDLDSSKFRAVPMSKFIEPLIQTDDILNITVQTVDPKASAAINQTPATTAGGATTNQSQSPISGFLVDKNGFVEVPMLGMVKVAGVTTSEAKEIIRKQALKYYKDPTVQVRYANYKVTVLGEVARPASYTVPNEKVTVFDAISLAGDLTIYGKRENVMLMRDNGTNKDIIRLDLTSSSLITSPYFYLKQNDVLYIEPTKAKIAANNAPRMQSITIILSVVAILVTAVAQL
jgi:polysaccharide export outer membrane protein